MAAILIFTQPRPQGLLANLKSQNTLGERLRSAKTCGEWGPKLDKCGPGSSARVTRFPFLVSLALAKRES